MEIQKIFSDYLDDERFFSVLIDEEELMLFSDLLEQERYFTSVRKAKKMAKKAMKAEQEFQQAIATGVDANQANAAYNKSMGKLMNQKGARKVLEHDVQNATTTLKSIKNDRAAEQIAAAIGNGDQEVKEQLSKKLKKSKGGKGVNVQTHIAAGNYSPEGVKQNVVKTRQARAVARSEANGARKQINELQSKVRNNQLAAEAAARKQRAAAEREMEKLKRQIKDMESNVSYRGHVNSYLPKPEPAVAEAPSVMKNVGKSEEAAKKTVSNAGGSTVKSVAKTTSNAGKSTASSAVNKAMKSPFLKRNGKALAIGGGVAALGGLGYGIYRHNKQD